MVEIPFLISATMCVQIYLLAAIFFLTCRLVTPKLSKASTSIARHDYVTRSGLFVIYVGFFELVFVLIVHVELSRYILSIVQPAEERCSGIREDHLPIGLGSYGLLVCILLSVVRCLVQSCALKRFSKSDVVSMAVVYFLPSAYLVALLCVRLWIHAYVQPDSDQQNRAICYQKVQWPTSVVRNSPVTYSLVIMAFLAVNFMYDFAVSGFEQQDPESPSHGHLCFDFKRRPTIGAKRARTYTNITASGLPPTTRLQITLVNDNCNGKASSSSLSGVQESRTHVPKTTATPHSTSATNVKQIDATAENSRAMFFQGDDALQSKAPSTCGSLREFLSRSARLYLALAVYFFIFVGCYQFTEHVLVGSLLEDFAPVIFTSIVIVNAVLRAVQVRFSGTINDEQSHGVVNSWNK